MHQLVHFLHQFMVEIKEIEINSAQRSTAQRSGHPKIFSSPFWPTHKNFCGRPWRDDNSTCKAVRLLGQNTHHINMFYTLGRLHSALLDILCWRRSRKRPTQMKTLSVASTWTKRRVVTLTAVERSQTFIASKKNPAKQQAKSLFGMPFNDVTRCPK